MDLALIALYYSRTCNICGGVGSVLERRTPEREVGDSKPTPPCCVLEQDTLLPERNGNI